MNQTLDRLSVDKVVPDPENPRSRINKHGLNELAKSIASEGVLQAIKVRPVSGGKFQVVFGHRRLAAALLVNEDKDLLAIAKERGHVNGSGKMEIPAIVETDAPVEGASLDVLIQQITENAQREDLSPIEEAESFRRAVDDGGITQKELAIRIGKTPGHVSKRLALLNLPDQMQNLVAEGTLPIEIGYELSRVEDPSSLGWVIDEIEEGYEPDIEQVRHEVSRRLEWETAAREQMKMVAAIEKKYDLPVVTTLSEIEIVEEGLVPDVGSNFDPNKLPAKAPAKAVGAIVSGDTGRWIVAVPEEDQQAILPDEDPVGVSEKEAAKEKARKQAERDNRARVKEERLHRLVFLSTVAHKAKQADVATLAMRYLVHCEVTQENRKQVAEILGLDPDETKVAVKEWVDGQYKDTGKTKTERDYDAPLKRFLDEADVNVRKAAAAVLITKGESPLAEQSPGYQLSWNAEAWGYAMFLDPFDFTPLPAEKPEKPAKKGTSKKAGDNQGSLKIA